MRAQEAVTGRGRQPGGGAGPRGQALGFQVCGEVGGRGEAQTMPFWGPACVLGRALLPPAPR